MYKKPTYEDLEQRVRELEQAQYDNNITEVFFNSLFEKHNAVMLLIESDSGVIAEANIAAQNYYGYSISTLKQMRIQEINALNPDEIAERRRQAANDDTNYFEFPHRLSSGEIRRVEVHSSPIIINKKKYLLSVIHDITKRKYAENALLESEHKWRNILINTPQIGISLDPKGRIIFANKHFLKLTGWESADIVGKDWFDMFIPGKIKEEIRHVFLSTIGQKDALEFSNVENDIVTKSGELRNVAWSNLVTKDLQGELVDVTCLGTDLTERKNYEMLLKKKNTDLKLAQRIASIGVWTLDPEVGVPEWSEEIYRIYERDPTLGPYPLEEYKNIYTGKWWEEFYSAIQGAITDGTPYDIELRLIFSSGKKKWIHAICEPESEIGPKGYKVRGTIQDITEKKEVEEKLRQSQKMESIGTLAGGIAHEFNNVLAIIMGNNELIMEELPQYSLAKESAEEIRIAGLRARDVVKQLLTFSRQDDSVKKAMDFKLVVQESMKLIRSTTPANIDIEQYLSADTYPVKGNDTQINQLLINLCNNAVDAMPEKGGKITVELSNETIEKQQTKFHSKLKPGQYTKLMVNDNGVGMDHETLERIFEPFFTTKDVGKGSGIGMAVVHGIVERHGGSIIADSRPGQGTTFAIFFPAYEGEFEQISENQKELPTGEECILYVDDEASIAHLGKRRLESLGYRTESTTEPLKALEMVKSDPHRFDLVITDMAMPNMTGDQLIVEILKIRQDIPTIICTGYSAKISDKEAKEMGVSSFAMKPLAKSDLATTVRKVLDAAKTSNLEKP